MPDDIQRTERRKANQVARLESLQNTVGSPLAARPPRERGTTIPRLQGFSATLTRLAQQREADEEQFIQEVETGKAQEAINTKSLKQLVEEGLPPSASPVARRVWQAAYARRAVTEYNKRVQDAIGERLESLQVDGSADSIDGEFESISQRVRGEIEEELGGIALTSDFQRTVFESAINQANFGRDGLSGLNAFAVESFSKMQEKAGREATVAMVQDQAKEILLSGFNKLRAGGKDALGMSKALIKEMTATANTFQQALGSPEGAAQVGQGIAIALRQLGSELGPDGEPVYEPEDLRALGNELFGSVMVELPAQEGKPGRRKKVSLLEHPSTSGRALDLLDSYTRKAGSGTGGGRVGRRGEKLLENALVAIDAQADALVAAQTRDPKAVENAVNLVLGTIETDDERVKVYLERRIRQELVSDRNFRLGLVDEHTQAAQANILKDIYAARDVKDLPNYIDRARDAGLNVKEVREAVVERTRQITELAKIPEVGAIRGPMDAILKNLPGGTPVADFNNARFVADMAGRLEDAMREAIAAAPEESDQRAALAAFKKSPEYKELIGEATQFANKRNELVDRIEKSLDEKIYSGQEAEALDSAYNAEREGIITRARYEAVRREAAAIADPGFFDSDVVRGGKAQAIRMFAAAASEQDDPANLLRGFEKASSVLGLGGDEGDPRDLPAHIVRYGRWYDNMRKELAQKILTDGSIKGSGSKKAAFEEALLKENYKMIQAITGKDVTALPRHVETDPGDLTKVIESLAESIGTSAAAERDAVQEGSLLEHIEAQTKMLDAFENDNVDPEDYGESGLFEGLGISTGDNEALVISRNIPAEFNKAGTSGFDYVVDRLNQIDDGPTEVPTGDASITYTASSTEMGNGTRLIRLDGDTIQIYDDSASDALEQAMDFVLDPHIQGRKKESARSMLVALGGKFLLNETDEKARHLLASQTIRYAGVPAEVFLKGGRVNVRGLYGTKELSPLEVQTKQRELTKSKARAARAAGASYDAKRKVFYGGNKAWGRQQKEFKQQEIALSYQDGRLWLDADKLTIDPWATPFYRGRKEVQAARADKATRQAWQDKLNLTDAQLGAWFDHQERVVYNMMGR